jgi:hypothetical protein
MGTDKGGPVRPGWQTYPYKSASRNSLQEAPGRVNIPGRGRSLNLAQISRPSFWGKVEGKTISDDRGLRIRDPFSVGLLKSGAEGQKKALAWSKGLFRILTGDDQA